MSRRLSASIGSLRNYRFAGFRYFYFLQEVENDFDLLRPFATGLVRSMKRTKKKIAAAVYEYQADCDGEWDEIQFDFVSGTAEIVRMAEWDTMVSKVFAEQAIKYIRACDIEHPPQKLLFAF